MPGPLPTGIAAGSSSAGDLPTTLQPAGSGEPAVAPFKVVVFDDDPTGSQTLHGCPLLLRWDAASLAAALRHPSPFLFLLSNSRALAPAAARARIREICAALRPALEAAQAEGVISAWLLVSRGDSTLRGHFPLEIEEIAATFGPFDATLLVPAFLEGGRTTLAGVHRLEGRPVHETPFARDRLFGYSTSYLPDWVAEKTRGRIAAERVARLAISDLEQGPAALAGRLAALLAAAEPQRPDRAAAAIHPGSPASAASAARAVESLPPAAGSDPAALGEPPPPWAAGKVVAVDACSAEHLANLGAAIRSGLAPSGPGLPSCPRLLIQSAASLLKALAPLPPQPRSAEELATLRRRGPEGRPLPGLVLVGSHVPLADRQLAALLGEPACAAVEVPVARVHRLLEGPLPEHLLASLEREWQERLEAVLASGRTAVLATSRGELACRHDAERRRLGLALAGAMARLVGRLAPRLGYVISKGGITSQTLLAEGLELAGVELQGQLLAGVSLVLAPAGSGLAGGGVAGALELPVVTLPGNLGSDDTLLRLWRLLEGEPPEATAP